MRIILTADLHYDIRRSQAPTEALAKEIVRRGGDALVFVGDCAGADLAILERLFALFESFRGPRLFTPGNHDIWTPPGADSLRRYEHDLPALCRRCGVHYLDDSPFGAAHVAVVGNIGWYDYSFRRSSLGIPLRFYQNKLAPGAALALPHMRHLVDGRDDLPPGTTDICTRWMDCVHVRWPCSDVAFAHACAARLRRHIAEASAGGRRVVAVVHHVPLAGLLPRVVAPAFVFATAFMGSELLGEACLEQEAVTHVYCGHSHQERRWRRNHLTAVNIGATYTEKRYEVLEI